MQIQLRNDGVVIEGYVNAIERNSKPLMSRIGRFIERICKGAFFNALKRNDDVHVLLNHNWARDLGSQKQGNLELEEDAIGLKARFETNDAEVVADAREGKLVGWSFGFSDRENGVEMGTEQGLPLRMVRDLDLYEVSILNDEYSPAYDGTLVTVRSDGTGTYIGESMNSFISMIDERSTEEPKEEPVEEVRAEEPTEEVKAEEPKPIDYSDIENLIRKLKEE